MLNRVKNSSVYGLPTREMVAHVSTFVAMIALFSVAGFATSEIAGGNSTSLIETLQQIGNFVSFIILGVAVPNGAYGFLQYMTAGSNVDQDEKGRKRIRNTFIGLAGVAVIQLAVNVFYGIVVGE